jgi:hypothetical protein
VSELLRQQQLFTANVGKLILYAYQMGYDLTFGEAWRTPEQAALNAAKGIGIKGSLHVDRLAVDFNLFRGDRYLPQSQDHAELGRFWKTLHPLNRWGGDFKKRDGNHYSMEWEGRK